MAGELQRPGAAILRRFTPLDKLDLPSAREICDRAIMMNLRRGALLFEAGARDDWTFYLVTGEVTLAFPDAAQVVRAGHSRARMPLAPGRPRPVTGKAAGDVQVLRIPTSLLEVLSSPPSGQGYDVQEIEQCDDEPESRLLLTVFNDYLADTLKVPSLPDVAMRVRAAVAQEDTGVRDVARIITADPGLAAKFIRIMNSPAYRGVDEVETCVDAVNRLGLAKTRDLVTSLALSELFTAKSSFLRNRMAELRNHSTRIAALSQVLAQGTPGLNPDRALLAGLVHDIGVLVVLAQATRYPDLCTHPDALEQTITALHAEFSAMVLRKWGFADDIVQAALESEHWERESTGRADVVDMVMVAHILSCIGTPMFTSLPPMSRLPALRKPGLNHLNPKSCVEALDASRDAVAELERILGAA